MPHVHLRKALREAIRSLTWILGALDAEDKDGKGPPAPRRQPLGFASPAPIPAGASLYVVSRTQITFRPDILAIPAEVASSFKILNIQIGANSQHVSPDPLPATLFVEPPGQDGGPRGVMRFDKAIVGLDIKILVENIGKKPASFAAVMVGDECDY